MFSRLAYILAILICSAGMCYPQDYDDNQLDSLAILALSMPDDTARLSLLETVSYQHYSVDSTMKYSTMELELAQRLDRHFEQSRALSYMSWCYFHYGEYTKSVSCCFRALGLVDPVGDESFVAGCYLLLSYNYYGVGDFDRADDFCRKALQLFDQVGNKAMITEAYRTLCLYCIEYNFYDLGQMYLTKAYDIDHANGYMDGEVEDLAYFGYTDYLKYTSSYRHMQDKGRDSLIQNAISLYHRAEQLAIENNYQASFVSLYDKMSMAFLSMAENKKLDRRTQTLYADSALSACHRGMDYAVRLGYDEYLYSLEITEIMSHIVTHKQQVALAGIRNIRSRFEPCGDRMHSLGDRYYEMMCKYNQMLGDYRTALMYMEKLRKFSFERYNFDLGTKINKINAQEDYERFVLDQDSRSEQRDRLFGESKTRRRTFNLWLSVVVIFLLLMVMFLFINKEYQQSINQKMVRQNNAIDVQNLELRRYSQEFEKLKAEFKEESLELDKKKKEFLKANRYIMTSLSHARKMQNMLMPSKQMMNQFFGDCLIYWKPLQTVSGDFYWANQIMDYRIAVAADCTGHGVPGAFMSMLGISTLNDVVSAQRVSANGLTAAAVIEKMRTKIITSLRQNSEGNEQYDCMDMSVIILKNGSHTMQYAGANRPIMIAGPDGVREVLPDDMPAGIDLMGQDPFTNREIDFLPGEVVYMYSDGITDQFGGKNGKMKFGSKRLKALIGEIHCKDFDEQNLLLHDAVSSWTTMTYDSDGLVEVYRPQLDDQLLLGIKLV